MAARVKRQFTSLLSKFEHRYNQITNLDRQKLLELYLQYPGLFTTKNHSQFGAITCFWTGNGSSK